MGLWENINIFPDVVGVKSNKKAWWLCPNGHSYEAVISTRSQGCGCPVCSNKKIIAGINDFATIHPELVNEWD